MISPLNTGSLINTAFDVNYNVIIEDISFYITERDKVFFHFPESSRITTYACSFEAITDEKYTPTPLKFLIVKKSNDDFKVYMYLEFVTYYNDYYMFPFSTFDECLSLIQNLKKNKSTTKFRKLTISHAISGENFYSEILDSYDIRL